jgi:hypothetical protein
VYRGQSDATWGLVPSLYRRGINIFSDNLTAPELYLVAEQKMLTAFFDRAAFLLPNFQRGPLVDRIIAQHFGVPTQLLDWTIDPFIALFFAVNGEDQSKDAAFYYFQPRRGLKSANQKIDLPWEGQITKLIPPYLDERIKAQKSVFTLQSFGDAPSFVPLDERELRVSHEQGATHPDDQVLTAGKIIIPADRRQQIKFQLAIMGVDASLIFPGLEGIGRRIADVASMQSYGGDLV